MTYELVSIVLPVYLQAEHISGIVRALEQRMDALPVRHETLLVVNGPDDGSEVVCRQLATQFASVRTVTSSVPGWGEAVRLGLEHANGDLLCYTNSARTNPDTLGTMLDLALDLPSLVIKANRKTRDSVLRHLGSLLYNLECRSLFDLSNFDINGTPKIFPRAFAPLLALTSHDDLIDAEFLATCRREGYLVLEVPVVLTRRRGGVSTTGSISALRMYVGVILLAARLRRLRQAWG
jgi:hypothetical protein